MEKTYKGPYLIWMMLLLLTVCNFIGWGTLYVQQKVHPEDVTLYGTFGTHTIINFSTYLTFDGDTFYLYHGEGGDAVDEGTWIETQDMAVLHGQRADYDLVIKGETLYLFGGDFDRVTRFEQREKTPVFITVNAPRQGDGSSVFPP